MTPSSSVQASGGRARSPLGWKKKLAYTAIVFLFSAGATEVLARVGSYLYYDRNPYYLLYGYRSWTSDEGAGHSEKYDGYFKFPPNQTIEYGTPEPCRINNLGFRGADFEPEKPEGTFRIVCLGASSTFGYLNRDTETYSVVLGQLLGDEIDDMRVEVINAGIPHFTTDNILAALESEIFAYEPDVLTIYTGCADAVRPLAESRLQSVCRVLDEYSAAYAGIRKVVNKTVGPVLFGQWTAYLGTMDQEAIDRQLALHEARTRGNFEQIVAQARERGIQLVVIRQPITSWHDRRNRGLVETTDVRPGYEEEYAAISASLARNGYVQGFEVVLLVQHRLVEIIDELAAANELPVVDNVALISEAPEGLGSKVHLTAEANQRLARALHEVVLPLVHR